MNSNSKDQDSFEQIRTAIESLSEMIKQSQISTLEMDLVKERIRKLYDQLLLPKSIDFPLQEPDELEIEIETGAENILSTELIDDHIQESETDPSEIDSEDLIPVVEKKDVEHDESEGSPDLFSIPDAEEVKVDEPVMDHISKEQEEVSVVDQLQKKVKIDKLREAIGINEKFFFINELFEGNLSEYNAAIAYFDDLDSLDDANNHLEELAGKYGWTEDQEALDQLKSFIERKLN